MSVLPRPPRSRMPKFGMGVATVVAGAMMAAALPSVHAAEPRAGWVPSTWTGVVGGAPVPGEGLPPAPMPAPLVPMPVGLNPVLPYEPQTTCDATPKPGAQRIEQIIKSTYGQNEYTWIPRGCDVGGTSEHKEGRAIDWMVDVRNDQQRANAEAFLNWLLGPDQTGRQYGHALQLGVMYIGWHDRMWRGYSLDRGWQELKGCFGKTDAKYDNYCHRNHIHISLTRQGASGMDPTGVPLPGDPAVPQAPEAPIVEPEPARPPAPAQPGPDEDLFMSIGAELGYQSDEQGELQPGEVRTVPLNAIPENATSALVSVTTREAPSRTKLRVGFVQDKGAAVSLRVPKNKAKTSMLSIPVSNGTVQIGASKAPVHVRIDVLGYTVDNGVYPAVGAAPTKLDRHRFEPGEVVVVKARGVGTVPQKKKKVTAVILRVTAKGLGQEGRFAAYPVGGADLGTSSAAIPAVGKKTSVVVADIGDQGQVALASSVKAKVLVEIVGYVKR